MNVPKKAGDDVKGLGEPLESFKNFLSKLEKMIHVKMDIHFNMGEYPWDLYLYNPNSVVESKSDELNIPSLESIQKNSVYV